VLRKGHIIVIVSILILGIYGTSQQAEASTVIISDVPSCESAGGTFTSARNQCSFFGDLTIPEGDTWNISNLRFGVKNLILEGEVNAQNEMDVDFMTNRGTITVSEQLISIGGGNFWINDCGGTINLISGTVFTFDAAGTNHGVIKGDSTTAITTSQSSNTVVNSGIIQSSITLDKVSIKDVSSPCPSDKKAVISKSSTTQEQNQNSQIKETQNFSNYVDISVDAPMKQVAQGVLPNEIICKEELELIIKNNGFPACVKPKTAEILIERGWAKQKLKQIELQKETEEKEQQGKFDLAVVEAAKKNIPGMQSLPKEIIKQCKAVKSSSDYQTFLIAVGVMSEQLIAITEDMNTLLTILELQGYDKHPEVGPLIRETRSLALETSDCIDELISRYGN